jgi:hypothetical protein
VVEHDLAKVGVEGSNPFARSRIFEWQSDRLTTSRRSAALLLYVHSFTTIGLRDSSSAIVKIFILGEGRAML